MVYRGDEVTDPRSVGPLKDRYKFATRVVIRRLTAMEDEPWEEFRVWSVRVKGKLLCLTPYEPDEPGFPPRSLTRI